MHTIHRRTHRAVAGAVLAVTLLAALATAAPPASAAPPLSAPRLLSWDVRYDTAYANWAPPAIPGSKPITSYVVRLYECGKAGFTKYEVPAENGPSLSVSGLFTNKTYGITVAAVNADGEGPKTPFEGDDCVAAGQTQKYVPFASMSAFATRTVQILAGRSPNATETHLAAFVKAGTLDPAAYIDIVAHDPARISVRLAMIRLYWAYFLRAPDHAGLLYWQSAIEAGTATLQKAADFFATSTEFKTTYGSLSNGDFVQVVYENVYNRDADPVGLAYWTGELNKGKVTRGKVMRQFSSLGEGLVRLTPGAEAADIWDALLGTPIPPDTHQAWTAHIRAGGHEGDLGYWLYRNPAFKG